MGPLVVCPSATALPGHPGADLARPFLGTAFSAPGSDAAFSHSDLMGRAAASHRPGRQPPTRSFFLLHVVLVPAVSPLGKVGRSKSQGSSPIRASAGPVT